MPATEINNQGFPDFMINAFKQTAKVTNSIILSRVPGGVGTTLISEGYDLKGFHVKAKSCNWGPMSGFICQLPIFNKSGFSKLSDNTKEIGHYLQRLKAFNGGTLALLKKMNTSTILTINDKKQLSQVDLNKELKEQSDAYKVAVKNAFAGIRKSEKTSGEWTGENTITNPLPFIPINRKLVDIEAIKKMRGVLATVTIKDGLIYCTAQNVTDDDIPENNKPTVIAEFLLEKIAGRDIWNIYHGRIWYKKTAAEPKFATLFAGIANKGDIDLKVRTKFNDELDDILTFSKDQFKNFAEGDIDKIPVDSNFPKLTGAIFFCKVNGIMNPFPPFPQDITNPDYYKNAVSGDYDLFAIWPKMSVSMEELIRQSEYSVGKSVGLGGKIFTTWIGYKENLGIEFVPGFKELNPQKDVKSDELKESADFGNMTNLCHLVAGFLNSFATDELIKIAKAANVPFIPPGSSSSSSSSPLPSTAPTPPAQPYRPQGNKAFHSDEGGRPGIMEIEYPIAVFFPEDFLTYALNNEEIEGKVTPLSKRIVFLETDAALIKSPEDFVAFILECMDDGYRVMLHYAWLTYLFYNALAPDAPRTILKGIIAPYFDEIKKYIPVFDGEVNTIIDGEKMKTYDDFDTIDKNKLVVNAKISPLDAIADYILNLKKVLGYDKDTGPCFEQLKGLFLSYAYEVNKLSHDKKSEVESLMFNNPKVSV